jgi:hypothetical protein
MTRKEIKFGNVDLSKNKKEEGDIDLVFLIFGSCN